jgi:hypothetical protein
VGQSSDFAPDQPSQSQAGSGGIGGPVGGRKLALRVSALGRDPFTLDGPLDGTQVHLVELLEEVGARRPSGDGPGLLDV